MSSNQQIEKQLDLLESVAVLMLEECHKTRKLLGGADRSTARKGNNNATVASFKINRKSRLKKNASV